MKVSVSASPELYCSACQKTHDITMQQNLCSCGKPLLVTYDYSNAATSLTKDSMTTRIQSLWRYRELLPVLDNKHILTLGEGFTPLLRAPRLEKRYSHSSLYIKDESGNPTGSFKARGLAMAVSKAQELGIEKLILPTAGNAGSATAAYCALAGIRCKVVMPASTPAAFKIDSRYFGADIEEVDGSIKDAGERAGELVAKEGWFSVATLKEPYRIEGKKTMGYELAEQFMYSLPDIIIYPTGGGTGLIGMWKAFDEMEQIGWIDSKRPKMVSVQSEGCAPIVRAFQQKQTSAEAWENPQTHASGLRVPGAIGDFLILNAIYKSHGCAVAVSETEIYRGTKELGTEAGVLAAPEGGATLAAFKKLRNEEFIKPTDQVVLFNTGSGYKYLEALQDGLAF